MTKYRQVEPLENLPNTPTPGEIANVLRYCFAICNNHRWGSPTELSHLYRLLGNLEKIQYQLHPPEIKETVLTMPAPATLDMQKEAFEVLKGLMVKDVVKLQDSE